MAASTDKFLKTGAATKTTLASPGKAVGAASININSAVNWPTDTAVVFAIRSIELVDGEYHEVSGTYAEFKGIVSGTTINSLTLVYGTDQVYTAGSTTEVFIPISSYAHNRMIDALLVTHDQDGTLKDGAVDTSSVLADSVVTGAKIANASLTNAKLSTVDGELGGAWVTWTPTYSNVVVSSTVNAVYQQVGKTVRFRLLFNVTSVSGILRFSLPVAPSANYTTSTPIFSNVTMLPTNGAFYPGYIFPILAGSSTVNIFAFTAGGTYAAMTGTSASIPEVWNSSGTVRILGEYEAA